MELRHLEAFVAVAEEQNFTRAARRLLVAQSGLSATIRGLERELHAPLFARTTRRVALTPAGSALLDEARRTLGSARAATEAVAAVAGLRRGSLTLGIMQATWLFGLPALLARYRVVHPGIDLRLQQASSEALGGLLQDRQVDVIFRTESDEPTHGLQSILLLESPLVAICSQDDALASEAAVSLDALTDAPQVGYPVGWGVRTLADRALRANGAEPRYSFEVNDTTTLLDLVAAGLGVALVPEALSGLRPGLHRLALEGPAWTWRIAAQTLAPRPPNPAAGALWEMLRAT